MIDAVRLAVGTLTILRVQPPRSVSRSVAATAMCLAPLVGLFLGLGSEAVVLVTRKAVETSADQLLAATLAVVVVALLTRGLHLDGLADTADGLGSGLHGPDAVTVMKQPDVGAFGVVTVLLVVMLQIAALDVAVTLGRGTVALLGGLVVSRLTLTYCARWTLAAAQGSLLGATVAGTVRFGWLALTSVLAFAFLAVLGWAEEDTTNSFVITLVVSGVVAVLVSQLLVRRCVARFGGITGDVMGAACEVAFATFVVGACLF